MKRGRGRPRPTDNHTRVIESSMEFQAQGQSLVSYAEKILKVIPVLLE